jgi:hypothetical protein
MSAAVPAPALKTSRRDGPRLPMVTSGPQLSDVSLKQRRFQFVPIFPTGSLIDAMAITGTYATQHTASWQVVRDNNFVPRRPARSSQGRRHIMAQFLFLYRRGADAPPPASSPAETQQRMQRWMAWFKDLNDKGHLKDRGQPLDRAGNLVAGGPQRSVTDGPYAEKDLVMGFSIVEAKDLAHATELSLGCPLLEESCFVEVRPTVSM